MLDRRPHVVAEDSAEGVAQRDFLDRQRADAGENSLAGLVNGEGHVRYRSRIEASFTPTASWTRSMVRLDTVKLLERKLKISRWPSAVVT